MHRKVQVWIASTTSEVLLFKIVPSRGGGWHPVTGGVEKGESFFAAAQRETFEETGISPETGEWIDLQYSHAFEGRFGKSIEHAFGLILKNTAITIHLDPKEMTEFKWVSFEEAKQSVG